MYTPKLCCRPVAAHLTKEDLKKVQDVNTLPAFDPDATAGLGNSLATTRSRILFPTCSIFFITITSCFRTALIWKSFEATRVKSERQL
jgi:hypothetical protein